MSKTTPRIYVACLAAYNSGTLHGKWIEVHDEDQINEEVQAMLKESPEPNAEEWAIHDFEGFGVYKISESMSFSDVAALAAGIEEHGLAFAAFCSHRGEIVEQSDFSEAYQGEWESLEAYVQNFWEDCGDLPKAPDNQWWHPANYTDWERMAKDLELSGDVFTIEIEGSLHVFNTA